jgi:hypothetical protein
MYRERNSVFPIRKAANTFRVFCPGGSATAGWQHPLGGIYNRYSQCAFEKAYPQQIIEVINVGAHAYAAYRVRLIFRKVIEFDPDLVVIYSGNNEFIEKRIHAERSSWFEPVPAAINRLYLVRRMKGSSFARRLSPGNTLLADERQHAAWSSPSFTDGLKKTCDNAFL